ncbi:hypothetical protein C8R44DRAFT_747785 [Mycena epipterygia]|nr:hypothetical protein C8R44DRAFT_747785 [Mycena epipterygia]
MQDFSQSSIRQPPQNLTHASRECATFNFNIHLRVTANSPQSESELDLTLLRVHTCIDDHYQLLILTPTSRKPTHCIQLLHGSQLFPPNVLQDALADKTYSKPDFLSVFWHKYQAGIIPSCKQAYRLSARVQVEPSYYPASPELRPALIIVLKSTFQTSTSGIGECYRTITLAAIWARVLYPTRLDPARRVHILLPTSPAIGVPSRDGGGTCAQL